MVVEVERGGVPVKKAPLDFPHGQGGPRICLQPGDIGSVLVEHRPQAINLHTTTRKACMQI